MAHTFVNQLSDKQSISEIFRVTDKQLRPNRNGNLYLQFNLSDKTGTLGARLWNATEALFESFQTGDYIRVEGTTQLFQGALQLIANRLERVEADSVDEDDYLVRSSVDVDQLMRQMREILKELNDPGLVNLADCFLLDEAFMAQLTKAPAGVKLHHAYSGGLLEHIVNMMEVVRRIATCYPQADPDLLIMGALVHDLAKVRELEYENDLSYSDEGQLIGHLVMGVEMLDAKVREAEKLSGERIDPEKVLRLKHIIVSHHGEYDNGSPKLPMTFEAMTIHLVDTLDSKMAEFERQMFEDPNIGSSWTYYVPGLSRKLFKGQL